MHLNPFSYTRIGGFGLIELMVCISIMALVSTIIVTRQSAFNGAVLLRNQAYEVAFTLREAQQLAVSGGEDSAGTYGVFFDVASPQSYYLFRDADGDNYYDANEQIGKAGRLDSRFAIRELYPEDKGKLAVVFMRPNFDPQFCANESGCPDVDDFTNDSSGPNLNSGEIHISKADSADWGSADLRIVSLSLSGQIGVEVYAPSE